MNRIKEIDSSHERRKLVFGLRQIDTGNWRWRELLLRTQGGRKRPSLLFFFSGFRVGRNGRIFGEKSKVEVKRELRDRLENKKTFTGKHHLFIWTANGAQSTSEVLPLEAVGHLSPVPWQSNRRHSNQLKLNRNSLHALFYYTRE